MKSIARILLLLLFAAPVLSAQSSQTRFFSAYNNQRLTVSTSAVGFDLTKVNATPSGAAAVGVTVECASGTSCPFRFYIDGTTAVNNAGTQLDYQAQFILYSQDNIRNFSAIRSGATDAILQIIYYR